MRRPGRRGVMAALVAALLPACGDSKDGGPRVASATAGDVFDETRLHEIRLEMDPEDWASILADSRGDAWRRAAFRWNGEAVAGVAVRPAGESSRFPGNPKMSLRLKFDELVSGRRFRGLERLRLDGLWADPSFLRDRLSYWVQRHRLAAPRAAHARLYVNGAYRGLYMVEEPVDDVFLRARFGAPAGDLYRIRGLTREQDPYRSGRLLPVPLPWEPADASGDPEPILRFQDVATSDPRHLTAVCDVETLLEFFACEAAVTNVDGFLGDFSIEDHYQARRPGTGLWAVIPWDPDNTWGALNDPPGRDLFANFDHSVLSLRVRDDPSLRARYKAKVAAVLAQVPAAAVAARVDFIHAQIREAAAEDPHKASTLGHFDWSAGYIKDFAAARWASLSAQAARP